MTASFPIDSLLTGDAAALMAAWPEACVDLIFADPPYNLMLPGGLTRPEGGLVAGVDQAWDRFGAPGDVAGSFQAYDAFTRAWAAQARRLLRPTGTLWVSGTYHNIFRVGAILQDLGFWLLNDVAWIKTNPMPNFNGKRLTNAHETLICAARGPDARPYFNYRLLKALNGGKQMRSDWTFPICGGAERLKDAAGGKLHPTQKPEDLLERILLGYSRPEAVVLDPFSGSGTTAAVAKRLGRRWVGIDRDADYTAAAAARLAAVAAGVCHPQECDPKLAPPPKIPFPTLVEDGLVPVGATLTAALDTAVAATVLADGRLRTIGRDGRPLDGSIHQTAKHLNGAATNGWAYWTFDGAPIDDLRRRAASAPLFSLA